MHKGWNAEDSTNKSVQVFNHPTTDVDLTKIQNLKQLSVWCFFYFSNIQNINYN